MERFLVDLMRDSGDADPFGAGVAQLDLDEAAMDEAFSEVDWDEDDP